MTKTISKTAQILNAAIEQRGIDNVKYSAAVSAAVLPAGSVPGTADDGHLTIAALALLAAATAINPTAQLEDGRQYAADDADGFFDYVSVGISDSYDRNLGHLELIDGQLTLSLGGIYNARTGQTIGKVTAVIATAARA